MNYDAVIIGAGCSGMSAALILARQGLRVALVEKQAKVGPLLRRFRRGNVWCDGGFHYSGGLLPGGSLDVLLRYLGIGERVRAVPMSQDGFDILTFDRREPIRIPWGMERFKETLAESFPRSRRAAEAYVERVAGVIHSTPFISFDMDLEQVARSQYSRESLHEFLQRVEADEEMERVLGGYGDTLYGASAAEIPMDIHAMVMGSFFHSAHTLERGGDSLVDAFEAGLAGRGVDVYGGRAAAKIRLGARRRVEGVELEGGDLLECRACISTIHPQLLGGLLGDAAPARRLLDEIAVLENTFAPFVVFLDIEQTPPGLVDSNTYYFADREGAGAGKQSLFVECCGTTPGAGEKTALCMVCPCRPEPGEDYESFKQRQSGQILRQTIEMFPALRGRCKVAVAATPRTYEALTGTVGGAIYGLKHSVRQKALDAHSGIGGLYLAGQSILASGVMGSIISGFLAASHLVNIQTLWSELQQCR